MSITIVKLGRPKVDNPKPASERVRDTRLRNKALGRVERKFILDADTDALFDELRESAGFSSKEKSDFLAALILRVANKNWLGKPFVLPLEEVLENSIEGGLI